jgi:hypothetical protein
MGNSQQINKINYEDMQSVIKNPDVYLIINTLPLSEQHCLIVNTSVATDEENLINQFLKENKSVRIVIYGRNGNDDTVCQKYHQLVSFGFFNVYVYLGGMFEWLMLQDIYGKELFPTTKIELDLLKYKPPSTLHARLLEYY